MSATSQPPDPTDEALLRSWASGDQKAGQLLFKRYFDALLRFFRRQLGADVGDLVQQTFLGCIKARNRGSEIKNFRAYLYKIARNRLYKHLGRLSGRPRHEVCRSSVVDLAPSPSRLLGEREESARLVDALTRLPLEQQLALYFYYVEDMSAPQVGAALDGLTVPAVRSRLRRALAALRELVTQPRADAGANVQDLATLEAWEANLPILGAGEVEPDDDDLRPPDEFE